MLVAAQLRYVPATKWGSKRYPQGDRPGEIVAVALPLDSGPIGGQNQNCFNPTTFLRNKEDRKRERNLTLPKPIAFSFKGK